VVVAGIGQAKARSILITVREEQAILLICTPTPVVEGATATLPPPLTQVEEASTVFVIQLFTTDGFVEVPTLSLKTESKLSVTTEEVVVQVLSVEIKQRIETLSPQA
jgi:hypothetical protein